MSVPLVSVLMTSYNREKYIAQAVESVLASGFGDFELIIADDCSADNTVAIARKYATADKRIRVVVNEQNLGDYPNRNKAASLATGKYLKYVDSDDLIYPHGLEVFVQAMESHEEAALGITSRNPIPFHPFPILLTPEQSYRKHFFEYSVLDYGPTGVIIRRDVFEAYGGFSGKRYVGDQECWLGIAARHKVLELPPSLTFWRQHEGQEFKAGQQSIDDGYFTMSLPLLRDVFNNQYCPLTATEKKKVLQQQHKMYAREIVKYMLKTRNISKGMRKFSQLGLRLTDVF